MALRECRIIFEIKNIGIIFHHRKWTRTRFHNLPFSFTYTGNYIDWRPFGNCHQYDIGNISMLPTVGDQRRCRVQSVFVNNCTRETFWKETLPPQLVPQLQSMFQKLEELRDLHRLKIKQEEEAKCERLFSKIEHVRNRFNRAYDRICRS